MVEQIAGGPSVILGVIGSDCHAVGNKIIEHALAQWGDGLDRGGHDRAPVEERGRLPHSST